jgi:hypothetical protein
MAGVIQEALFNQSEIDGANHAAQYDALLGATASADERQAMLEDLAERREHLTGGVAKNRELLLSLGGNDVLAKAFDDVAAPLAQYDEALAAVAATVEAGKPVAPAQVAAVNEGFEQFDGPFDALVTAMDEYIADLDKRAADEAAAPHADADPVGARLACGARHRGGHHASDQAQPQPDQAACVGGRLGRDRRPDR